jgi:hypothetical protein
MGRPKVHGERYFGGTDRASPEYATWVGMVRRCEEPTHKSYRFYGALGVRVCPTWRASFTAFLADMGRKPTPAHSIDRINSLGNYEPANCRWATRAEQGSNMRNNRRLTLGERTQTLSEWAREVGISKQSLRGRLWRGWPVERALTEGNTRASR